MSEEIKEFSELNGYGVKDAVARAEIEALKEGGGGGGKRYSHRVNYAIEFLYSNGDSGGEFDITFDLVCDKASQFENLKEALRYAQKENMNFIHNQYYYYTVHSLRSIPDVGDTGLIDSIVIDYISMLDFSIKQDEIFCADDEASVVGSFADTVSEFQ